MLHFIVELHDDQFHKSNKNVQNVTTLKYLFDVKNWIAPCIDEIHYHTKPHVFLFKRNFDGNAEMFYKQWSHNSWKPSESKGCQILKVNNIVAINIWYVAT